MPDLHLDAIHAFWDSYDRRTLYRVIVALERMVHWALVLEPDVEALILELGRVIDMATDVNVTNQQQVIRVLANTHASRAMRILQSIDMAKPGAASQLLMHAEEVSEDSEDKPGDRHSKLFLRRNLVFERLQLLSRVFAPQRLTLVLKASEQMNENA